MGTRVGAGPGDGHKFSPRPPANGESGAAVRAFPMRACTACPGRAAFATPEDRLREIVNFPRRDLALRALLVVVVSASGWATASPHAGAATAAQFGRVNVAP